MSRRRPQADKASGVYIHQPCGTSICQIHHSHVLWKLFSTAALWLSLASGVAGLPTKQYTLSDCRLHMLSAPARLAIALQLYRRLASMPANAIATIYANSLAVDHVQMASHAVKP